ncbi:asparagine synthase-related protein [Pseudomonas sp. NPDC089569]|uniref:asparagine synthase-related protein n=1 Tax=Pseudomonas sp. NPDC089569 TaxID=3390722 RepID=UPI003D00032C
MVTGQHGNIIRIISSNEGSIPIYFCQNKEIIHFNWDFKEITSTRQSLILDFEYLIKSTFEPTYTNRTAFQGISMLTAGASCTFSDETCNYKFPNTGKPSYQNIQNIECDEAAHIFLNLLKKKINLQLSDPNQIAIELSGGLDSSTVAIASALTHPSSKINTYGVIVSDPLLSESQQNRRNEVIKHIESDDYEIKIMDHLPSLYSPAQDRYYLNSEAYGDAFDSIWSQAAKNGHHTLFNGCGGDELFPQFLDEDFSTDRLRSVSDDSWSLYNQILMSRLTPKVQDILGSYLPLCSPKTNVDTGLMLAMARRAPLLLRFNLIPMYPLRDNKIIEFCNTLPLNLRLNKTLLTNLISNTTHSRLFSNYPKETFMHADETALLAQKKLLLNTCNKFKIIEIGLIDKKNLVRDLESINIKTPRYIFDYLLNILSIERFLKAYL